jgi:hypothetical protein
MYNNSLIPTCKLRTGENQCHSPFNFIALCYVSRNSYFENSLIEIQFLEPFRREGNSLLLRIIAGVGVESILATRNAADKDVGLQSRDPTSLQ